MKQICEFDPVVDLAPVDQVGFVDLRDAFVNNSIPGDVSVNESSFNGVEDPSTLMGRPRDVFESFRQAEGAINASQTQSVGATSEGEQK